MTGTPFRLTRRGTFLAGAGAAALPLLGAATRPAGAQAETMGVSRPQHYRFELGDFEITTVLDGFVQGEGPHPIFGEDQDAEAVRELAEENFLPADRFENQFTPVVVDTGEELVVFDSGNGAARRPTAGNFADRLADAGYSPERVDVVVITHCHPDHIGGLMEDGEPTFPNARYVIGQAEYDFWSSDDRMGTAAEGVAELVRANVVPLADNMTFLSDGDEAAPGITALAAHGHTPGHMAFHLESGGRRLVLWADTTNHYVASLQRPDWHVRYDMDKEAAAATRRRILDMVASDRIPAAGYHMPFPAVGFVEKSGDSFRWVPASYQLNL